jgi:TonB family protein
VVFLSVTVDESGAVTDVRPRGTIDPEGFYDAAVTAIRQWRTNAPRWRGLPVKAAVAVDVTFAPPAAAPPPSERPPEPAPAFAAVETTSPPQPAAEPVPSAVAPQTAPPAVQQVVQPTPAVPAPGVAATRQPEPEARPVVETPAPRSEPPPMTPVPAPYAPPEPVPAPTRATTQRPLPTTDPFVVEYYYKVRWGFADEFWRLFNRNHWPLLRRQMEMGRILEVRAIRPRYHATEDGRWDYRVTIVFRSAGDATAPFDTESLERQLFSDFEGYRREERRRFELLLAHWDVPITAAELEP